MQQNRKVVTIVLFGMTVVLLGATIYISTLLNDANNAPTQIKKTKASAQTYNKTVNLQDSFNEFGEDSTNQVPEPTEVVPSSEPTLIAKAPTLTPTVVVSRTPTTTPTVAPTLTNTPTPTLQPLLAYKSTTISQTPTLIPIAETGGQKEVTKAPSPTKKTEPTIVSNLPEAGWIQTSTILFIVATTTILFSLIF